MFFDVSCVVSIHLFVRFFRNIDFSIRFSDGRSFRPQSILAIDREHDLALIKINASKLPVLKLGNSQDLIPGQAILSIGNPLGYEHSVSRGVFAAIR